MQKIICVCSLVTVLVMYWANSQCPIENIMSCALLKSLLSVVLLFGITNMFILILPKFFIEIIIMDRIIQFGNLFDSEIIYIPQ